MMLLPHQTGKYPSLPRPTGQKAALLGGHSSAGFSLVEVAVALAIFAFAIIPIIGLMGTALKTSRESIDASTTAHIFRIADAMLANSHSITSTNLYFSNEGEELTNNFSDAVFLAEVSRQAPSDAAGGLLTRRMWQVKIVNPLATNVLYAIRSVQVSRDINPDDF